MCAACRAVVTHDSERVEMNGSHTHCFMNPAGLVFRIGCFLHAPGARELGPASDFFSWFPGFAWRVAACRVCGEHLGWSFNSEATQFWGLILERLLDAEIN
jgi:hypothetical protein